MQRGIGRLRAGGGSGITPTSNVMDLFIVAGQSNAVGRGTAAQSPAAPNGRYINGATIQTLADPFANASTGSFVPSFSNAWAVAMGRKSGFVPTAADGSSLVAAGTGWNPTGTLRAAAVSAANTARATIVSSSFTIGNVYVLWLQGEQEAITYDGTTITAATYASALGALADYFAANITGFTKMCVIQICGTGSGTVITLQDALHSAYEQIRYGLTLGVANDPTNLMMAYDGAHHFLSLAGLSDGTHFNQVSLNVTGTLAAKGLASPRSPPAIAPFISSTNYSDSTVTPFKGTRTASHTTAAGTTCLIVAVASSFVNTNATGFNTIVTFNGVTMKPAAVSQVNSASPVGASTAGIYYLDDVLYGSSLASVTANIVVTPQNNQSMIDWTAINAKDVALVDAEAGTYPAPDAGVAAIADSIWTYYPTIIVSCAASVAASATPLTCTFTNATKLHDHSLSTGTLSAQTAIGYSAESAAVVGKTITATFSAVCTHRALVSVAFRARIAGE